MNDEVEKLPAEVEQKINLPVLPQKQTDALMMMIQGATLNPEINTDVIEKLWTMQKESQDRDAKAAFAKAKAKAQKKMPASIKSNAENKHTHSTYSDLTAVNTLVVPVYASEGFSLSFNTGPSEMPDCLKITAELLHQGGHSENYEFDLPIDTKGKDGTPNKTEIHGRASTVKYGQRYLVCMIWNVATGDDNDGNAQSEPVTYISEDEISNIQFLLDEKGYSEDRWLKSFKLTSFSQIQADDYQRVLEGIGKMKDRT